MKSAGMLRDEHDDSRDGDLKQLMEKINETLTMIKE
jgi:hypothetical protein